MSVLTLNCGSSSVKYSVYDEEQKKFVSRGVIERVGGPDCPDHTVAVGPPRGGVRHRLPPDHGAGGLRLSPAL
jgi:hypothetical protein